MGDPAFTTDELRALEGDPEFQRRVSTDAELDRLFNPQPDEGDERELSAFAMGSGITIAGVRLPPPTIGTFRLLSIVGSEFIAAERKFEDLAKEIILALFVLHFGHRAVAPVCQQFRYRRALDRYRKSADTSPAHLEKMLAEEKRLASELAAWDRALVRFASTRFRPAGKSMIEIVQELDTYLAAALAGLELLPQLETSADEKKSPSRGTTKKKPVSSPWFGRLLRLFRSTPSAGRFPS